MRALFKLFLVLLLLAAAGALTLGWLAFSSKPVISNSIALTHEDIARAKAILKRNDPRRIPPGAQRALEITREDLNLAADYVLRKAADGGARITLTADAIEADATLRIEQIPIVPYLNVHTRLTTESGSPEIAELRLGQLDVPPALAYWLLPRVAGAFMAEEQQQILTNMIGQLRAFPDRVRLTYRWNPAVINQARDTLLAKSDRNALRYYHDRIVELQAQGIGRNGSLLTVLQPLFADALRRSQDLDPISENKALLTVMGTWGSRRELAHLVPDSTRRPGYFRLKLEGRTDFGQHFVASAALAARGDRGLSDAVGLFKEISDTDHGSGFSFTDITADRAGTRFGELATHSVEDARYVQQRLAAGVAETDIMPPAKDLPENLRGDAFKNRFGSIGSRRYQALIDEIDARIDACSMYRE